MNSWRDNLKEYLEHITREPPFHLLELKSVKLKSGFQIKVVIDRENGFFSHDDCRLWSARIQDFIDRKNLIEDNYRLEVSSPGIGRPLKEKWEFVKNLQKNLSLEFTGEDGSVMNSSGLLKKVDDFGISVQCKKADLNIAWQRLLKAQVKTPW